MQGKKAKKHYLRHCESASYKGEKSCKKVISLRAGQGRWTGAARLLVTRSLRSLVTLASLAYNRKKKEIK